MDEIKRGDQVMRRGGRITTGTVLRVYRNARTGKLRADVLWHNANRSRIGATSPDKRGSILVEALKLVGAQANEANVGMANHRDNVNRTREQMDGLRRGMGLEE